MTRAQDMSVDRLALLDEQEVMLKLTHRLEGLLIVVHACDALAFTLQTIDSFIQTSDRRLLFSLSTESI